MSFSVQLTPDLIPVEPGATTPISVVVINKADEADRFELEIEGVDPEWTAVPVPIFGAEPNETHTERIFFKPARTSESLAGNYPFAVRIRSLISGESKTVQAVLEVKVFNHVSMEISPKKGFYSVWRKKNSFAAVIVNLGNSEHTLQLIGNDPEDSCAYEFESEQVTIGPGQQKEVEFHATPTHRPVFAGGRLIGFSITARGVDHPSVVSNAQAQLEQRPFVTPTGLILTIFVAIIIGLWYLMKPQPLEIVGFTVNAPNPTKGNYVTVSWKVAQANHVKVTAGNDVVSDGSDQIGKTNYKLTASGLVHFKIVASSDSQRKTQDVPIIVKEPETAPDPEILNAEPKPARLKFGSSFELDYSFSSSVTTAILEPVNTVLDPSISRLEITPNRPGGIEYTIVAKNQDGKTAKKSFKVTVDDVSDATIIAFSPSNTTVPQSVGKVTLSWQVTGAARVELSSNPGETEQVDPSTTMIMPLTAKTVYTLTAYDSKGRKTSQSRVVDLVADPPVPDPNVPPVGPPTGDSKGGAAGGGSPLVGGNGKL